MLTHANIQPTRDRVLVRRLPMASGTALVLPDPDKSAAAHETNFGEVVAVGPGARDQEGRLRPLDVRVGDHVLFGRYLDWEDVQQGLCLIQEADIRAVVNGN